MTLRNKILIILLLISSFLGAQEPRILIQTSPERPVEGSTMTLTLLVEHGEPDEVNVLAPPIPDGINLDFMLKGPRHVYADEDRWTAIEFRFIVTNSGTITFEPFTILTPRGRMQTEPFNIIAQKTPSKRNEIIFYRLSWENVPTNLKIGENAVVVLRVNNWKNTASLPESGLFLQSVPMGHIVETLQLSENEKSSGIALKLRIIPLQTGVLTIANRRLTIEDAIYEVPVLRIPVHANQ